LKDVIIDLLLKNPLDTPQFWLFALKQAGDDMEKHREIMCMFQAHLRKEGSK
jgi:hypothetical protein